jgi:hypothetical protein
MKLTYVAEFEFNDKLLMEMLESGEIFGINGTEEEMNNIISQLIS